MLFWLIIAALLLAAILLLVLPLLKNTALGRADAAQRNVAIVRQQLAELRRQLDEGALTQTQHDDQYQELMQDLGDELEADGEPAPAGGSGRWVIPLVVLFVPLCSLGLYFHLADPQALEKAQTQQQNDKNMAEVRTAIPQIIARLKQQPDDLQGWLMLGKSYSFIHDYPQAAQVFAKLNQLAPDQPAFMLAYAEALAMSRNGQLAGEPAELAYKAVRLAPDDKDALWMAAIASLEAEEQSQAQAYLQKLQALLPADSDALPKIRQMIAELAQPAAEPSQAADAAKITVQVAVDPAIAGRVRPEQIVFIYAQAVDGPKMPLAIARKRVADLPLSLELNDSMAMQPNLHLADFKQLRIVARISATGDASTRSGDFIGEKIVDMPVGEQPVSLLINQEVK